MLSIYFDGNLLNSDSVFKLTQKGLLYTDTFKLGSTVCREFDLWVDKSAVSSHPSVVTIDEDGTTYATLHVDSITDNNDFYYAYTLLDAMVYTNQVYNWPENIANPTVQDIVNDICSKHHLGTAPTVQYGGDLVVNYTDYVTARDMLSYIAELQAGFAYVDNNGNLQFKTYNKTPTATLTDEQISDFELGAHHQIKRVVYNSVRYVEYGDSEGDTLYLNTDNILFTDEADSEGYTIDKMVNHIGHLIKDFEFYNLTTRDCEIPDAQIGDIISINGYNTICQYDYNYNGMWVGGYDLEVKTPAQEETEVVNTELEKVVNNVNIRIDRQEGTIDLIGQRTTDLESTMVHLQVDADSNSVRVTNENSNPPTSYTAFQGDGMRVYVNGEQVAEATAQRFNCDKGLGVQDWAIEHGDDATVLMIYRRR